MIGTAADRPEEVFVARTKPSYVPSPAFEGTVIDTPTEIAPRAGIETEETEGETHVQSARRYISIVNVHGRPARPLPERLSPSRTARPSLTEVAGSRTRTSRTFAWWFVFEIVFSSFGNRAGAGYGPDGRPAQFEAFTAQSIAPRVYV